MKKYIGVAVVVLIVAVCIVWIFLQENITVSGNVAEIRVDNEVVYALDLNRDTKVTVQGKNDITLVVIVNKGNVYVESSECPDKICVNKGRISKEYETIVCLPARTVVEVKTSQQ